MLENELDLFSRSIEPLPWMRDPRIVGSSLDTEIVNDSEASLNDWQAPVASDFTVRSTTDMDSSGGVEQRCCPNGRRGLPVICGAPTGQVSVATNSNYLYSEAEGSFVHSSSLTAQEAGLAFNCSRTPTYDHRNVTQDEALRLPAAGIADNGCVELRSCLRHHHRNTSPGRRVCFSFAVAFWFPCESQLQLCQHLFEPARHDGVVKNLCNLDVPPCTALQAPAERVGASLQGGSCRSLVMSPVSVRPPTPPIPVNRWSRCFNQVQTGTVIDVDRGGAAAGAATDTNDEDRVSVSHAAHSTFDDTTFAVFDILHHSRVLRCRGDESPQELAAIAFDQTPLLRTPRHYRIVQHNLPGLPNRQIVIWGRKARDVTVFPVALGTVANRICTIQALRMQLLCKPLKSLIGTASLAVRLWRRWQTDDSLSTLMALRSHRMRP